MWVISWETIYGHPYFHPTNKMENKKKCVHYYWDIEVVCGVLFILWINNVSSHYKCVSSHLWTASSLIYFISLFVIYIISSISNSITPPSLSLGVEALYVGGGGGLTEKMLSPYWSWHLLLGSILTVLLFYIYNFKPPQDSLQNEIDSILNK